MSDYTDLIARLRTAAEESWECCGDIHIPIIEAADALEALQAERDAIDALHQPAGRVRVPWFDYETDLWADREYDRCSCGLNDCPTHRILHPGEEPT